MTEKERVTASVSPGVFDTLDDEAERREISRSATVTEIVKEWERYRDELDATRSEVEQLRGRLDAERERREQVERELAEKDEADDSGGGRSSTFVDQLAAAALVVAPVAFAVGAPTVAGGLLAVVSLWVWGTVTATGDRVTDFAGSIRDQLADAGGVFGFFLTKLLDKSEGVEDPETLVERVTRLDVVAAAAVWAAAILSVGVWVASRYPARAVEILTPTGVVLLVVSIALLMGVAAITMGLVALASIAIRFTRERSRSVVVDFSEF